MGIISNFIKRLFRNEKVRIIGKHTLTFRDANSGRILRQKKYSNAVCSIAKIMIAQRLAQTGNDCNITYCALGTGAFPATPAASTTLVTELVRKTVTNITSSSNVVSIATYFGASEGNGVLTEMGYFGEAATLIVNGTMINHAAITETKTASETLTIQSSFTIS